MREKPKVLVVDDDSTVTDGLKLILGDSGYIVRTAATGKEGLRLYEQDSYALVLVDLQLPDQEGLSVLRQIKQQSPTTEVIIITGYGSIDKAVEATKSGAFYFVEKPFEPEGLMVLVEKALERRRILAESENLRQRLKGRDSYYNIVGKSKPMQDIYEIIDSVAKSDANILIMGESGTGKELIANAVHYSSLRAKKPFVKINCSALPKELIEAELFGHTKGAYTGATRDSEGLVGQANTGSLMLDEITEMPVELQPKLLRVLQERVYTRLGEGKSIEVDFRLISTTNRDPTDAVRDGLLREDLYYRISTITIEVPPLRERAEDVQYLADHFLHMYSEKYKRNVHGFSQNAYERIFSYHWPGNVRELEHAIERAVLLCKREEISAEDLPFSNLQPTSRNQEMIVPPNMTLEEIERLAILQTLQRTKGNKQAAAAILGIYRPRLYSKIKKHNLTEYL
ncbi:MAG: sigma-54 dependent transcriptional regulator [Acidobacteriota bacterium]